MRVSQLLVTAIVFGLAVFAGSGQVAHGATITADSPADTGAGADVCPGDDDCDGFTTTVENFIGTDPFDACADTRFSSDEPAPDAWPPDMNDDQRATTFDLIPYVTTLNSFAPGPPYTARLDFTMNGIINTFDLIPFISLLGKRCAPFP